MKLETILMLAIGGILIMKLTTKKSGRDLIKEHEGYSDVTYNDTAGKPTIGWGHKILPNESFTQITKAFAEKLLDQDIKYAENAVRYYVTAPLTQNQYDALVSFVYNVGVPAFINSTLLKKLNAGDYNGTANEFKRWKYVTVNGEKIVDQGLVNRRAKETTVFIS